MEPESAASSAPVWAASTGIDDDGAGIGSLLGAGMGSFVGAGTDG